MKDRLLQVKNLPPQTFGVYKIIYLLFLAYEEYKFIENEPIKPIIRNKIKRIFERSTELNNEIISSGIDFNEIFKELSEEKRYAIHNILTMLIDSSEEEALNIEDILLIKINQKNI
jgi:hypothetical protein